MRIAVRSVAEEPLQPTLRLAGISAGVPIAPGRNRQANNATHGGITASHRTHASRRRAATWWDDRQQPHPSPRTRFSAPSRAANTPMKSSEPSWALKVRTFSGTGTVRKTVCEGPA